MKNVYRLLFIFCFPAVFSLTACQKDQKKQDTVSTVSTNNNGSFLEEFTNVGELAAKGWVFVNNSNPIGQSGWRQGRYEAQSTPKFPGIDPYIGFPAYSAAASPNDFISCDASAVNYEGAISAWLISPVLTISDGDSLIFYTRAIDDTNYPVYLKDRVQVRLNFIDGSANVGNTATSVGSFTTTLIDINSNYGTNDPSGNPLGVPGYPRYWARARLKITGVPNGTVSKARFAFRYLGTDCGISGGSTMANYPGVVGIDSLAFIHH